MPKIRIIFVLGGQNMLLYETLENSNVTIRQKTSLRCTPHLHSRIEAVFMRRGRAQVTLENKTYTAEEGDTLLLFPNRIHSYYDSGDICADLLICPPEDIAPFCDIVSNCETESPVITPKNPKLLADLFLRGEDIFAGSAPLCGEAVKAYAGAILAEMLLSADTLHRAEPRDLTAAQKILQYCDLNYKKDLNLDVLSSELGYSKYYISRIFSNDIKTGFSGYIRNLRIHAAKRLLRYTDMNITDIAYEVGYTCVRTFNRHFFEEEGVTPSDYANKMK